MANQREKARATVAARSIEDLLVGLRERLEWQRDHGILPALKPGIYDVTIKWSDPHPDHRSSEEASHE
jgi:hypothetical protein